MIYREKHDHDKLVISVLVVIVILLIAWLTFGMIGLMTAPPNPTYP